MRHSQALLVATVLCLCSPPVAQAAEVVVFAAASLKTGLDDFAALWQAETGHTVTISYAGSGQLAKQVMAGAPADIFISASPDWMDAVEREGLVAEGRRRDLLGNRLVLVAHGRDAAPVGLGSGLDLKTLLSGGRLARMARLPAAIPSGTRPPVPPVSDRIGAFDSISIQTASRPASAIRKVAYPVSATMA